MKRSHDMPFGAQCLDDGRIRFRLWAPVAKQIDVCLERGSKITSLPLIKQKDGWFELATDQAAPSSRYKFQIDGEQKVPDPASRFQPEDVHGPSEVIDPQVFDWEDQDWLGRPWADVVFYELHVGTFTPEGTFAAAEKKLDYLRELGITAIELMPLSDFPGRRNWGYDGVLPFAPDSSYGSPDDLKRFIQAAHRKDLMVFLDVVYNHFGPDGNYLRAYAPQFFTHRHSTPWGDAINFDGPESRFVRDYFVHNAIYWLEEYHLDGLRLDAVHAIADDSRPDILTELAQTVRAKFASGRHVHLVLENENNAAKYLGGGQHSTPELYDAQWNDDIHHALHVVTTGETDGYYGDYAKDPIGQLGRCLAEGFAFQDDPSDYRNGARRGEISKQLSPQRFVSFLQNHDQIGNRPFGDRITNNADAAAIRSAMAVLLLAPSPPLLFMGEEFGARTPFLFFCDFSGELAKAVTNGRRNEFKRFTQFSDPVIRAQIPDPNAESTFTASKLDWEGSKKRQNQEWLRFYRDLLSLRQRCIVPMVSHIVAGAATFHRFEQSGLTVQWSLDTGKKLNLIAILGECGDGRTIPHLERIIYPSASQRQKQRVEPRTLASWDVVWYLQA
jgi:malto-oligosyltrehalose trehalohydrolase